MSAVQHSNDDLLADVAPLGQADRPILDAGFERKRVFVHVDKEEWPAAFDSADLGGAEVHLDRTCAPQRFEKAALETRREDDLETRTPRSSLTTVRWL